MPTAVAVRVLVSWCLLTSVRGVDVPIGLQEAKGPPPPPPSPRPPPKQVVTHDDPTTSNKPPPPSPRPPPMHVVDDDPTTSKKPRPPPSPRPPPTHVVTHDDPTTSKEPRPPPPNPRPPPPIDHGGSDPPRPPAPPCPPPPPPYSPIVPIPCDARVNVTLVLDGSGSVGPMVAAVRDLAHNIVGTLDFTQSHAAVHAFHEAAYVLQEMTSVAANVEAAIDAHGTPLFPVGGGTNVDIALSQIPLLAGPGNAIRIAILISDGFFPMASLASLTLANALKTNGVLIYTLSFAGALVSTDVLHSLASAPSSHFAIVGSPVELWDAINQNLCAMCAPIEAAWIAEGCCVDEATLACQQLLYSANAAQCDEC